MKFTGHVYSCHTTKEETEAQRRQEACPGPRGPEAGPGLESEFLVNIESETICPFRTSGMFPLGSILDSWCLTNLECLQ